MTIKNREMKRAILFVIMIVFLTSGRCYGMQGTAGTIGTVGTVNQLPFYKPTRHKMVKRMKQSQVRKAQKGKNFYFRKKGKMRKR